MNTNRSSDADHGETRALSCWYCDRPMSQDYMLRDGILRPRTERDGGPYHLYSCTCCNRQNQCEKTPRGRWFSSPGSQPTLLDYILGRFVGQPQDFLKTMSWYAANEERRRYCFEHDADYHYSGGWLKRILRGSLLRRNTRPPKTSGEKPRAERRERHDSERPGKAEVKHTGILAPWQILGVEADASREEIRKAFHKLAVQYHPDKVHHLGEDFQKVAHAKFMELQRAYERLIRQSS